MLGYSVYVVFFDDGRIKIGVSKNPEQRMKYYSQEVRRNFGKYFTWYACKPFSCKQYALATEKTLCRWLSDSSIPGHREWFSGATDTEFDLIISQIDRFRLAFSIEDEIEKLDLPYNGYYGHFKNDQYNNSLI